MLYRLLTPGRWYCLLLLALSGAAGALSMQPFAFWHAIFITLIPPILIIDHIHSGKKILTKKRLAFRALAHGWVWGFGYFTAGLWWLGIAFLVEADQFAWAMPFGVIGLPAVLAFYPAIAFTVALFLWSQHWSRIFVFACVLTIFEWLRGHLMSGFPWNTLGMAFGNHLYFMQAASLIGLYGLTLLTILAGSAPAMIMCKERASSRWAMAALSVLIVGGLATFGYMRIPSEPQPTLVDVRLRIVQPNVPQDDKFNASNDLEILEKYLKLSREPAYSGAPTHYIWPESAFPFLLHRHIQALNRIGAMLAPTNASLITGAARMDPPLPGEEVGAYFNAIQVVDANGIIRDTYDKVHLVPFGEYEPAFSKALLRMTGLRHFISIPGGFSPAVERKSFSVRGLPAIAAIICYEVIFSNEVMPADNIRPGLMLNVTNDGWFGDSPGPHQHFAQARLRSVEEGLPLVRASNSGISGVIDPYGRILKQTALNQITVVDSELPMALEHPTFFRQWPNAPLALMLLLCLSTMVCTRRCNKKNPT